ncbi:MAG: hypothetical protein HY290_06035 [Planctomycetia bacterium]|nr:hypothetical protein [Planctomycetia bacterium]
MRVVNIVITVALVITASGLPQDVPADDGNPPAPRLQDDQSLQFSGEPLAAIRIEGNDQVPSERILQWIETQVGEPLSRQQLKSDVRRLLEQRLFLDIEPRIVRNEQGPVLIIRVRERPLVKRISFSGNRVLTDQNLLETAEDSGLKVGGGYAVKTNREAVIQIVQYYQFSGYPHATVKLESGGSQEDREVAFRIDEGAFVSVNKIAISGNKAVDENVLRTHLRSSESGLGDGNPYRRVCINISVAQLKFFYHDLGFCDAQVDCRERFTEDGTQVELTFEIDEGKPFDVRFISIDGELALEEAELELGMRLRENARYEKRLVNLDLEKMLAQYALAGHAFAQIEPHVTCVEGKNQCDVRFSIREGKKIPAGARDEPPGANQPTTGPVTANRTGILKGKQPAVEMESLRSLDALTFAGVKSFDERELRAELKRDYEIAVAGRPGTELPEFLATIERQIREGFRHAGFPDVKVRAAVQAAAKTIEVRVDEGLRYKCGDVAVVGVAHVSREAIVKAVTEFSRRFRLRWKLGESAPFDDATKSQLRERIEVAFAENGYDRPQFDVAVKREGNHTATLAVKIGSEGPQSVVGRIEIDGLQRDSREEFLKYLELRPGMTCENRFVNRIKARLRDSGRYLSNRVVVAEPELPFRDVSREVYNVHITVREYTDAPSLADDVSAVERALLKLRAWLDRWSQGTTEKDVVLTYSYRSEDFTRPGVHYSGRMVISPRNGQSLTCVATGRDGRRLIDLAAFSDERRILIGNLLRGATVEFPNSGEDQLRFTVGGDAASEKTLERGDAQKFRINLGWNLRSHRDKRSPAVKVVTDFAPVFMLSLAHSGESRGTIHDGICEFTDENLHLKFEADTGRLIELRRDEVEYDGVAFVVTTSKDAFQQEVARLEASFSRASREYDRNSPWKSLAEFAVEEWLDGIGGDARPGDLESLRVLRKLIERWSPPALSELLAAAEGPVHDRDDPFWIPTHIVGFGLADWQSGDSRLRRNLIGQLALPLLQEFLPARGWWQLVGRDLVLMWPGQSTNFSVNLADVADSAEIGPLGECLLATLSPYVGKDVGESAGLAGLRRLSTAAFRRDYEPLLAQDSWLGRWFVSLAEAVRSLDESEIRALCRLLPATAPREQIATALLELKADPRTPIVRALSAALDRLWLDVLRTELSATLRGLAVRAIASRLPPGFFDDDKADVVPVAGELYLPAAGELDP